MGKQQPDPVLYEFEINLLQLLSISDRKLAKLKIETQKDSSLQDLKHVVKVGWPKSKQEAPTTTMLYWNCCDEISTANGIVFKGERVIVPKVCRQTC